nr:type IV secretory system conjugative DNA transfer family protein [Kineosporia rhizophila]
MSPQARRQQAKRIAPVVLVLDGPPGTVLGREVGSGQPVLAGWEDVQVQIWGPRRGKTTTQAVPSLLAAPGPAIATSNKRDLLDASAGMRAKRGRVWVFDPQGVAGTLQPAFCFNPLTTVRAAVQAQRLAALFVADTREPGARTDPQWDTAGADLLAWLMLAAAADQRPLGDVWSWVTDPEDRTPITILRRHGHDGPALSVQGVQQQPDKMRGSVYGTAQRMARPLINPQLLAWVTPTAGLPAFDPERFVSSKDTLYALSREGAGSAGAIVTALTSAVCEAAEQKAIANLDRSGRLAVPLVCVLDEAANVCRWPELPALYSHYGSRGINLITFLQSYAQGVSVWGQDGMATLWSAATIRIYGGGVADQRWLSELSDLIGDHDETHRSITHRRGERSVSVDVRQRRTITAAQLAALPRDRIILFAGSKPLVLEPQPWYTGDQADEINAAREAWAAQHD